MRLFAATIILLICVSTSYASLDYSKIDPGVEIRGIWIDAGAIPKTVPKIREMVHKYAHANFNLLIPETICRGYAIYPSTVIARDPRFAGAADPLPIIISEAHKLGIEVHPWVWVFRAGYTKDKGAILAAHPAWAELDRDGEALSPNGGYWISPANMQARDFLAELFAELICKYDVDGLHLDYIRYETEDKKPFGYSPDSISLFKKQYGIDPIDIEPGSPDQYYWNKFRERLVNTFMQRIYLQTKSLRPDVLVSAAVGSYPPDARLHLLQNWSNWAANGWLNYIAPMSYSSDDGHFGRLIMRQKEALAGDALLAEGIGMYVHKETSQTTAQIAKSREMGAQGQIMFAASYADSGRLNALRCGAYSTPASLPFRDPQSAIDKLKKYADYARVKGDAELADFYFAETATIYNYVQSLHPKPYVVPTPPPLKQK
ncbi:MAG: family 10 glycosylhydrolase [Armatimonadetes bacterium]|jgi:uncharacterized lipoprotein YddW (UPF0748 family)|nr:family 10 glycosylhydrolase [Armatimonadota bacterium]